jgi:hypothetical protein
METKDEMRWADRQLVMVGAARGLWGMRERKGASDVPPIGSPSAAVFALQLLCYQGGLISVLSSWKGCPKGTARIGHCFESRQPHSQRPFHGQWNRAALLCETGLLMQSKRCVARAPMGLGRRPTWMNPVGFEVGAGCLSLTREVHQCASCFFCFCGCTRKC